MGNSASSPKAKGNAYKSKSVAKKKADAGQREAAKDKSMQEFVERIFEASGALRSLEAGETLIEQGVTAGKMFFIKEGRVDLVLKREGDTDVELATRSTGDVLGELSLLLGHPAAATAKAATTLTVLEVDQQKLLKLLADDNLSAGQLFKVVATYLSERISELSGRMRSVVTKGQAPGKTASLPTTDISHARAKFGLASDQRLIGVYQCSVRREVNAVKEQHAHFGVLYIFDSTLCFDLKMFAFNKQMVIDNADIVSFLRSEPAEGNANTVEVQSKGQSVELQINEDFEEACLLMEACRLKAKTGALGKSRSHLSDGASGRAGEDGEAVSLEMFHVMLEPIIKGDKSEQDTLLHELDLHPQDWDHFLSVAKTLHYKKGEYVVQEGQASATLYQILRGALRVELLLPSGCEQRLLTPLAVNRRAARRAAAARPGAGGGGWLPAGGGDARRDVAAQGGARHRVGRGGPGHDRGRHRGAAARAALLDPPAPPLALLLLPGDLPGRAALQADPVVCRVAAAAGDNLRLARNLD